MKKFVAYGPGFSGDYDTMEEAMAVLANNLEEGQIYIRLDQVVELTTLLMLVKEWKRDHGPIANIVGEPSSRV